MFAQLLDELKIIIIMNLPCKTIRMLTRCCKSLYELIKDNDLITKRKFLGFPRTEKHYLAHDFGQLLKQDYNNQKFVTGYLYKIKDYNNNFYLYLKKNEKDLLRYINSVSSKWELIDNHCACYDINFLAALNDHLCQYLAYHSINLKEAIKNNIQNQYLTRHHEGLIEILNNIELPITLEILFTNDLTMMFIMVQLDLFMMERK